MTYFDEFLKRPTMLKIILYLKRRGPSSLSAIVRDLGTNKPRAKRYLLELVEMGYVGVEELGPTKIYYLKKDVSL